MLQNSANNFPKRLVWVYPANIVDTLDCTPKLEITKEMRSLGWQVDLVAIGAAGKQVVQGVDVLCMPSPNIYFVRHIIFHLRVIYHILMNWKLINVVFFHQFSLPWLLPLRLLNIFSKKHPVFVMDSRTVPMENQEKAKLKDKLRGKFHLIMTRLGNLKADGVTTITQRMADLLGIPAKKLWGTWPSGVNMEEFSIAHEERQWPGFGDIVKIIYVGVLHYERNLMTLCKAVIMANQKGMNFKLFLYGEGTEKKDLQAFADQNPEAIEVFGKVPHDQIPRVLAQAHVGVLPFPDEEKYRVSSPIKLFEYMGAGMPILATRIVCHTDVIGDGEYAFWANNADVSGISDALQQIWCARLSLSAMGEKSLKAAFDWTYKTSAKRLSNALHFGLSQSEQR